LLFESHIDSRTLGSGLGAAGFRFCLGLAEFCFGLAEFWFGLAPDVIFFETNPVQVVSLKAK
jgi:hypothetical protein